MDFNFWKNYFLNNKLNLKLIEWDEDYNLSTYERETIIKSIQQFQLGENSEGKYLINNAKKYVLKTQDQDYYDALLEFIREEQRHARDLAKFMRRQDIPLIQDHWVDQVFRKLRRFAGLESSVMVLITAEIIAKVYYKALKMCTNSKVLNGLCDQILQDEEKHVEFQSETLRKLTEHRNKTLISISRFIHRALLEGTLIIVWNQHNEVFRAGGYSFSSFCSACRNEFKESKKY
ncbi:ferritin-like domain-containing protein [Cohnella pontilimi]|uniref:Ferritin-like domain-containing protein n=1 Tax=Cohnella pontilimi TaxID=2564100 RepID=A0A4U0FG23_9BACL|nr:ferritin-like domain-containing protein [Cohnella pontilimi]TJY43855.1 ferritin-like domain-containing protein [Cohnella pontilimi]